MFLPGFLEGGRATRTFNGSAIALPAGGTPFTFTAVPIGVASADRIVIIALMYQAVGAIASMTIGGISAAKVANVANGTSLVDFWAAAVPLGTTANVVLGSGSGTNPRLCISSYSLYGVLSPTPFATATDITSPYNAALSFGANCVAIAAFLNAATTTETWTGITEDVDAINSNVNYSSASAQDLNTSVAINVTPSSVSTGALVAAAWSP